jgi:hypothetical protein
MASRCDHCSNSVTRKLVRMIKSIVSIAFATALMGSVAFAQTSTSSTSVATQPSGVSQTTTTTTESFGTVTEFTPGQALILKTEAGEPMRYKFGKTVTYVTSDGKVIEASKIRKDSKVRVHYVKEGDDMLVDKVIVTQTRE